MTERPLRARVLADHPSVRAGLRALLLDAGIEVEAGELEDDGFDDFDDAAVDVEVRDLAGDLAGDAPDTTAPVLWLVDDLAETSDDEERGGRGYLRRDASAEELAAAARAVAAGLRVVDPRLADSRADGELPRERANAGGLTARELEVLQLVAMGLPNKTIALELGISDHTVKSHVGAILGKLQAASRTEAVMAAARSGLLAL